MQVLLALVATFGLVVDTVKIHSVKKPYYQVVTDSDFTGLIESSTEQIKAAILEGDSGKLKRLWDDYLWKRSHNLDLICQKLERKAWNIPGQQDFIRLRLFFKTPESIKILSLQTVGGIVQSLGDLTENQKRLINECLTLPSGSEAVNFTLPNEDEIKIDGIPILLQSELSADDTNLKEIKAKIFDALQRGKDLKEFKGEYLKRQKKYIESNRKVLTMGNKESKDKKAELQRALDQFKHIKDILGRYKKELLGTFKDSKHIKIIEDFFNFTTIELYGISKLTIQKWNTMDYFLMIFGLVILAFLLLFPCIYYAYNWYNNWNIPS